MKIEEIQQQCETLSDEQLLLVVNNKQLYTEKIVRVAYQEIKKRGLSKQKIKEIEKVHARQSRIITGGAAIWVSGFLCSHLFNKYYFKAATINRLAARTANQE